MRENHKAQLVSKIGVKSESVSPSVLSLFTTPWAIACQSMSMEFSRQEYWSQLPFPSPSDLPYPGFEPVSPASHVVSLPSEPPRKPKIINVRKITRTQHVQFQRLG